MNNVEGAIHLNAASNRVERRNIRNTHRLRHRHSVAADVRPSPDPFEEYRFEPNRRLDEMNLVTALGERRDKIGDVTTNTGVYRFGDETDLQPLRAIAHLLMAKNRIPLRSVYVRRE
jgi:hypothetical protein